VHVAEVTEFVHVVGFVSFDALSFICLIILRAGEDK
jgi:hypothetical protein